MRPLVVLAVGTGSGQTTVAEQCGRSAESVININQYRRTVKPMHDLFVEPTKQHAGLIIPEGGENRIALEVRCTYLSQAMRRLSASVHESVSH
jgi:uridine kinase